MTSHTKVLQASVVEAVDKHIVVTRDVLNAKCGMVKWRKRSEVSL